MHFERCLQMHYFGSTKRAQRCKNMSKMPQNQGRGLMLDWTRSQNARRRAVGTVACFLPVLAIVLWGPSSAFTIAGISITRASTQQSYYSLRAALHYRALSLSAHTMTSSSSSSSECNVEQILDRPCNAADRLLARRLLPRKRLLSCSALFHSTLLCSALLCSAS